MGPRRDEPRIVFIDSNDQLQPVFDAAAGRNDALIDVNRAPFKSEDLPRLLDGCEIAIVDHSYMPTNIVSWCTSLREIVFLGPVRKATWMSRRCAGKA